MEKAPYIKEEWVFCHDPHNSESCIFLSKTQLQEGTRNPQSTRQPKVPLRTQTTPRLINRSVITSTVVSIGRHTETIFQNCVSFYGLPHIRCDSGECAGALIGVPHGD